MNSKDEKVTFGLIADRLKALADPSRLLILHHLFECEMNVSRIVEITGFNQANVSRHLRILRERGLVKTRRAHRNVYYSPTSGIPISICDMVCRSIEISSQDDADTLRAYRKAMNE